jgi:hypothetical protein
MTMKRELDPTAKPPAKQPTLLLTRPQGVPVVREEYPGTPQVLQDTDTFCPSVEKVVHFEEHNPKAVHIGLETLLRRDT